MRYMMFMIPAVYGADAVDAMPSAEQVAVMMAYNQQLADAGVLVSLDGLHPPASAQRWEFTGDAAVPVAVPTVGAVGGYWILDVESHEQAVGWAQQVPAFPGDVIELRRIQEMADFDDDVQAVLNDYDI